MSRWLIAKTTIYKGDLSDMKTENPQDALSGVFEVVPFTTQMEDEYNNLDNNAMDKMNRHTTVTEDEANQNPYEDLDYVEDTFISKTYEVPEQPKIIENLAFRISPSNLELFENIMSDYLDYLKYSSDYVSNGKIDIYFDEDSIITDDIKQEILDKAREKHLIK